RKTGASHLIITFPTVSVTTHLLIPMDYLSALPAERSAQLLKTLKSHGHLITHDLTQRVINQCRKVPNLICYIYDSLDCIEKKDNALKGEENPIENRKLLIRRKKK